MASTHPTSIFFLIFALFYTVWFVHSQEKRVSAFYVIGDSLMDVGNNNYIVTVLKADFLPYGLDFAGGKATGRFTNGKNAADFFAEELGVPSPPPYLALSSKYNQTDAFFHGINFASAGAGVLDSTNKFLCIPLSKQIDHFTRAYEDIAKKIGDAKARKHLSKAVFAVNIGSNDIFGYIPLLNKLTPQQYVDSMLLSLRTQLKRLYNIGARKLFFIGLAPVGCCPYQRNFKGDCNEETNQLAYLYNHGASSLLSDLKSRLPSLNYSFFNTTLTVLELFQNPSQNDKVVLAH